MADTNDLRRIDAEFLMLHPQLKKQVIEWLNEHGIDPNHVPIDACVNQDEGLFEIEVWDKTSPIVPAHHEIPRTFHVVEEVKSPFPKEALM